MSFDLTRSRALWNRSRLDLESDEALAQILDWGELDAWIRPKPSLTWSRPARPATPTDPPRKAPMPSTELRRGRASAIVPRELALSHSDGPSWTRFDGCPACE